MRALIGVLAYQLNSETIRRLHVQEGGDADGYDMLSVWGMDIRPGENRFHAVTRKYQHLQRLFLSGPWDVLLTVEQDMLIPPDALRRLAALISDGADIAYGLYVWRYEEQHWWSAHPKMVAYAVSRRGARALGQADPGPGPGAGLHDALAARAHPPGVSDGPRGPLL
jgi:hypothetical protein